MQPTFVPASGTVRLRVQNMPKMPSGAHTKKQKQALKLWVTTSKVFGFVGDQVTDSQSAVNWVLAILCVFCVQKRLLGVCTRRSALHLL
jgi:hypothetical protein